MANIKISELNEITKSQTAYNDYLPIVDSSANETKKISVENLTANNVYLLAVVKPNGQVPTPVAGAKYYNEVRNKIYYAPDDEHWYEYGTPVEGIFYVVLGEKGNYAYDSENETLVSVGGGSGSEIVIGDEEPTEDTKMIIDTDAFDPQYSDITDEYSEASNMAYSCDYINNQSANINAQLGNINSTLANKENKYSRGNSLTLGRNGSYLIIVKPFTTVVDSGALGIVLGGYDIKWIYNSNVSVSRNDLIYSFTSGLGACLAMAIQL